MNKLIVIGIAFILIFTINLTLNNSHASSSSIYQVPFNIINNQNVSTPNPFQQLFIINENNYKGLIIYNGSFANFEFTYPNGQIIPAWIELNNSGNILVWLKLGSIPAYSSISIYLDIYLSDINLLSSSGTTGIGENPKLSKIYGEYDDGASVFDFYDNFAGNLLNGNNWVYGGSGTITINNYVYIKSLSTPSYIYIISSKGFNPKSSIFDVYYNLAFDYFPGISILNGQSSYSNGYFVYPGSSIYDFYNGSYSKPYSLVNSASGYPYSINPGSVISMSWQSSNKEVYIDNYGFGTVYFNRTFSIYTLPSTVFYGIGVATGSYNGISGGFINVSWVDVRAFPPNGVMPSISQGVIVSVSYPSSNQNSNNQNISIYNATSENFQFNSQYFSFIIDPLFIFSLLIFLSLIFIIFMAIAVVKKRR